MKRYYCFGLERVLRCLGSW